MAQASARRLRSFMPRCTFCSCGRLCLPSRERLKSAVCDGGLSTSDVEPALRELHEELDLDLPESDVLGLLDDYPTRSGFVITPFVVWGGADPAMRPHPDEVLSVHRVAFRELCRPDSPRFVAIPESDRPVVQIPIGGDLIHAPTGAVLLQFRRVAIEGVSERVAGYEQPVFAWR